jgi:xylose isomerase
MKKAKQKADTDFEMFDRLGGQNYAILAGHSFEHEIATAVALGVFGSIDMNRNDYQSGWDTDQFPNNVPEVALAYYHILQAGGFVTGGTNFDAKLRRQSLDATDLIAAHIGGMKVCAKGLRVAAAMLVDGRLQAAQQERYTGWQTGPGENFATGSTLESIESYVLENNINPSPVSGRQEILENLVNRFT